jgi:hypothetical protein
MTSDDEARFIEQWQQEGETTKTDRTPGLKLAPAPSLCKRCPCGNAGPKGHTVARVSRSTALSSEETVRQTSRLRKQHCILRSEGSMCRADGRVSRQRRARLDVSDHIGERGSGDQYGPIVCGGE